jgi:hypothetical protein
MRHNTWKYSSLKSSNVDCQYISYRTGRLCKLFVLVLGVGQLNNLLYISTSELQVLFDEIKSYPENAPRRCYN